MSSRRGGAGGRKGKNSKSNNTNKQGGDSNTVSKDTYHNLHLPCSRLLEETCKEMWTIDDDESSLLSPSYSSPGHQERSDKRLGRMLRHHLLEKRRQEVANIAAGGSINPSGSASATTPPKKKKKKKKKKSSKQQGADGAADNETADNETGDVEASAATTASTTDKATDVAHEDSSLSTEHLVMASSAKEEMRTSASSAATSSTLATSTTSSLANDAATATTNTSTNDNAWTTPVDAFLDRLLVQQGEVHKRLETEQSIISNNTSSDPNQNNIFPRDLEAFVQYLNKKHGGSNSKGLVITQQEVEAVCQGIDCDPCKHKVLHHLKSQGNIMQRQLVVLGGISFDNINKFPRNHHNGLAIPVDNPSLGFREEPTPSVDFDYVALEEGDNPTAKDIKEDLQGVPYFCPQLITRESDVAVDPSSVGSTNNQHHKHPNQKGANNTNNKQQHAAAKFEWRFVSSSSATPPQNHTLKDDSSNNNSISQTPRSDTATNKSGNLPSCSSSNVITVQDLEHMAKNVMLPLSMQVDELIGAYTGLSEDEISELHERILNLDVAMNNDCHNTKAEFDRNCDELRKVDGASNDGNLDIKGSAIYVDCNRSFHDLLQEIILDITWDRTLWLTGYGKERVIRTTESWWKMVEHVTEDIMAAILATLSAVEEYEASLQEIAENSGRIPDLYVSKSHRDIFAKMLTRRADVVHNLLNIVHAANYQMEEVWPISSSGAGSTDGLKVTFRRKWYATQEMFRIIALRQTRDESTKKGSTSNAKTKKDTSQRNKTGSSPKSASSLTTAAPEPETWVQALDIKGHDMLTSLVDLLKCESSKRLSDIKEEQIVRCQKVLGLLSRVATEILVPLAETDKATNPSTSFVLQDDNLKSQCQSLAAQIQKEEALQQQQQLLAAPGEEEPSVTEQRRTVANLTIKSIKLLRHVRKCATDSQEANTPAPILPLRVVSWLGNFGRLQYVDMRDCSYSALVHTMLLLQNEYNKYPSPFDQQQYPCSGEGSVMPRLTSILLALFYRKLSEQVLEWHADIAEQELLTNMTAEKDSGLQTVAIGGDPAAGRNGTTGNSGNQGKAGKKTKKKQKKPTQAFTLDGNPESGQEAASGAQKISERSAGSSNNEMQRAASDGTATTMNGHESLVAEAETTGKKTKSKEGSAMKENKISRKGVLEDANKTAEQFPEWSHLEEMSTVEVDKDMGVKDHLGVFDSAECFLVKRLTALFKEAAQDSSSVVII